MLLQIRDFIYREGVVSIQQLTRKFHMDEQALQPMLDIWVNKGAIGAGSEEKSGCKGACMRCPKTGPVFYRALGHRQ